jgi:hypothetical protein
MQLTGKGVTAQKFNCCDKSDSVTASSESSGKKVIALSSLPLPHLIGLHPIKIITQSRRGIAAAAVACEGTWCSALSISLDYCN